MKTKGSSYKHQYCDVCEMVTRFFIYDGDRFCSLCGYAETNSLNKNIEYRDRISINATIDSWFSDKTKYR